MALTGDAKAGRDRSKERNKDQLKQRKDKARREQEKRPRR